MIYICIPAHNEDRTIGVLLWKVRQVLANFPRDYQILVADDASTDATVEVLGPYERVLPLSVYRNTERKGYASSLEILLREAVRRSEYPRRDVIATLQGDFTEDPESIVTMLKRIEAGADIVSGELPEPDEKLPRSYRWARRAARYLSGRRSLPEGVNDALSGQRVYRVQVLRKALEARQGRRLMTWDGWAANAELLLELQPYSRRTETLPVMFRPERIQREHRFDFWGTLKQAWGVARGRPGPLADVVLPQPSVNQKAAETGQGHGRQGTRRLETVSNGSGGRAYGNGRGRRTQEGSGREARDTRQRRGREEREQRAEAPQRRQRSASSGRPGQEVGGQSLRQGEAGAQESRPRRERQPRPRRDRAERREQQRPEAAAQDAALQDTLLEAVTPDSVSPGSTSQIPGDAGENGAPAEGAPPRKRRRRRRGSGASKNAGAAAAQSEMFDPAPGVLEPEAGPRAPETVGGGEGAEADAETEGGEPAKKRRRSRGRRGGRGRSRRTNGAAEAGAAGAEDNADTDPADSQGGESRAEAPATTPPVNEGQQ